MIEDILFLATGGVFKLVGGALKYISKFGGKNWFKWLSGLIDFATRTVKKMITPLTNMTNKFGQWVKSMLPFIDKVSDYFKKLSISPNVGSRVISKIPLSLYKAAIISSVVELGLRTASLLLGEKSSIDVDNITPENIVEKKKEIESIVNFDTVKNKVYSSKNKQEEKFYNTIKRDYPKYSNLKRNEFQLTNEKKDGETIFMIKGVKYYLDINFNVTKI